MDLQLLGVFKVRWSFLLKDVLSLALVEDVSSVCRMGKDCTPFTCIFPQIEETRLLAVLSVCCSTCCYLDKITVECHTSELGWFSLGSGGPFFLGA